MQFMMPLSKAGEPIFRQIYLWFRRAILLGAFRPGDRLPATRDLADQLGVSRTVILLAYDQLLAEGFVVGRHGSGTYVAQGLDADRPKAAANSARMRLSRFGALAAAAASKVYFPGRRPSSPVRYDFAYGRSDVELFPFETWRRILLRRTRKAPVRELDYGPTAGSLALREAIAAHVRRSRAVVCDASQMIVVNGSQQALDLVARVLLNPGDRVAIEDPQYQGAREIFRAAGARLHPVSVDRNGLNPAKLPNRAQIVFVTPSHQIPTGVILSLPRRVALLEWAKRNDAVVIEDDYDGEFRYEGQPLESLQGLDTEGRVVYLGTFSRTIFPALRIGYLVAPKSLVPALTSAKWLCDRHTATLEQETLAEFIAAGAYERHLRRARRRNAARRRALLDAIHEYLGDRVAVTGDGSGTHVVLWPGGRDSEEALIARAAAQGVGIYGISRYFLRRPSRVGILVGYSRLKEEEICEGIRRLGKVIP
jgi:GntR family transcriptional regulator / MocR family aminotransferase